MSDVVIYNLGGTQILGTVSVKHAIKMLLRQVAVVVDAVEGQTFGPFPRPRAVELVRYIHTRWVYERTGKVPYTRAALMRRDRYRCAYCGRRADTVDHVVPRCQGGTTTWQNTVAACGPCNEAKGGRTPEQARMPLRVRPFTPTLEDLYPRGGRR